MGGRSVEHHRARIKRGELVRMTLTFERAEYDQLIGALACYTSSSAHERARAIKQFLMQPVRNPPMEADSPRDLQELMISGDAGRSALGRRLDDAMGEAEDLKESVRHAIQETVLDLIEDLHLFAPEFPGKEEIVYRARRAISRLPSDGDRSGLYDEIRAIWLSLPGAPRTTVDV